MGRCLSRRIFIHRTDNFLNSCDLQYYLTLFKHTITNVALMP